MPQLHERHAATATVPPRRDTSLARSLGVVPRHVPGTAPAALRGRRVHDTGFARGLGVVPSRRSRSLRVPESAPVPSRGLASAVPSGLAVGAGASALPGRRGSRA